MMQKARTTVAIPVDLLEGIDEVVRAGRAVNRNDFFSRAVRLELERLHREAVDREFAAMAADPVYQREAQSITESYQQSDWEALRVAEDDS